MLAPPDSTLPTMIAAVATTLNALDAASEIDVDREKDDKKFFAAQRKLLAAYLPKLIAANRAIEDYDLGEGSRLQARVEIGDVVLDRGISVGRKRTALALVSKTGLGVEHAFGRTLATLTKEKIAIEPHKTLQAVDRMDQLPAFPERAAIAKDLTGRANTQQGCLDDRDAGDQKRAKLVSNGLKVVNDAAHQLASIQGALAGRFTRQRDYVAAFFLDVRRPSAGGAAAVGASTPAAPAATPPAN